jgi:hypothetical protein
VLVLLPETYHGPLHITSPDKEPVFLDILQPQCEPVAHPYDTFYTTFVTPLSVNDPKKSKSIEHTGATKIRHPRSGNWRLRQPHKGRTEQDLGAEHQGEGGHRVQGDEG